MIVKFVLDAVVEGVIGVLGICHRANHRWGEDSRHLSGLGIDPDESTNMSVLLAFE